MILNHLLKNRDFTIILTVLIVMITPYIIYTPSYSHTLHYVIGFTLSLFLLLTCYLSILITDSIRLVFLMVFITMNMAFDGCSVISDDLYWLLKGIRYTDDNNFNELYLNYEIFCILYFFIDKALAYIGNKINNKWFNSIRYNRADKSDILR